MADWTDSVGWPSELPFRFYTPVRQAFLMAHERHCPHKIEAARWAEAVAEDDIKQLKALCRDAAGVIRAWHEVRLRQTGHHWMADVAEMRLLAQLDKAGKEGDK